MQKPRAKSSRSGVRCSSGVNRARHSTVQVTINRPTTRNARATGTDLGDADQRIERYHGFFDTRDLIEAKKVLGNLEA